MVSRQKSMGEIPGEIMKIDPNDEIVEPKKPDTTYMSPAQMIKALKEYKTDRRRWLKTLAKQDPHVKEVDESIELTKEQKRSRKKRESEWKKDQLTKNPQSIIDDYSRRKESEE